MISISVVSPQESYDYFVPLIGPEAVRRYISAASLAILQRLVELASQDGNNCDSEANEPGNECAAAQV